MRVSSRSFLRPSSRSISLLGLLVLLVVVSITLAACAEAASPTQPPATSDPVNSGAAISETNTAIHLKIGVSPVPHGDIIHFIKDNLASSAGLDLEIIEFTDYVQPNLALQDGTLDANYFQHVPYLEDFNKQHNTDLVSVIGVHIEPLGIYSRKIKLLSEITDNAVISIPNDATNAGRALNLLAANGLITLKDGIGYDATVNDITSNPKNLQIIELEAAQLVRSLDDTTLSVINGNYALEGGLNPGKDALALESSENNPYTNVLAVKKGHENDEGIQILSRLLNSPEVKKFIEEKYNGSVLPAFD